MSPETNGNPPSVTKRKKNREKKLTEATHNFDLNMPSWNYFPASQFPYSNFSIPNMVNGYYSFMNCPDPSEPTSLPVYPMNYPGYPCPGNFMDSMGNLSRHSTLSSHMYGFNRDGPDYMSLPVPVETVDPNDDSKRRFSDPGLPNDSDSSSTSYDETVQKLTRQIHCLTESNNRLSREVKELRLELNMMKQQQASRHYEREYEPGMLADVIREVREAARVREDALLARVRHAMEEKHLTVSQLSLTMEKDRHNDRISKLEEQLKNLTLSGNNKSDDSANSLNLSVLSACDEKNKSARQVLDLEREALELRRELQDTRAKKEEADQKVLRLSTMLRRNEISASEASEDGKISADSISTITTSSPAPPPPPPRVFLSGPVTSL